VIIRSRKREENKAAPVKVWGFTAFLFGDLTMGVTMGKVLKTSDDNRKCIFPNCTHTLSIYNHESYCHIHLDKMPQDKKHKILTQPEPV
jgi:hypothetical protein